MELSREFFYDEVRDGFYIPAMMKRAWGAELGILSEIDKICKKHNIPYYISYGTLLGAVRCKEFIPWDDDIDLMMRRKDFNSFSEFAKKELPEELQLCTIENSGSSWDFNPAVKIVSKGYSPAVFRKYAGFPYTASVDIFPLDALAKDPKEELERKKIILTLLELRDSYGKGGGRTKEFREKLKTVKDYLRMEFDREEASEKELNLAIDQTFQIFNGTGGDELAYMPAYLMKGVSYPVKCFGDARYLSFCGRDFSAPREYKRVLELTYKDYQRKVKAGGDHAYPFFKEQAADIQKDLKENLHFQYCFSKEDLKRPEIYSFRESALKKLELFTEFQHKVLEEYSAKNYEACLTRLSCCQEEAISLGTLIEKRKGEGTESVFRIEEYCESLFLNYQKIQEEMTLVSVQNLEEELNKPLSCLESIRFALEKDFKRQIVFLPHSVKHFASLAPLVKALSENETIECKVIPIPYYDYMGDGSRAKMYYEGNDFPKEFTIVDYCQYDFAKEAPDCIIINSPYDEYNPVWTVHPFFYSKELKKYTKNLLYIPYFVTDEIDTKAEEDGKAFSNMEFYVRVPGIFHADLSIVQSEKMKESYLAKIAEFTSQEVKELLSRKISGAGSCLFGEKEGQGTREVVKELKAFLLRK